MISSTSTPSRQFPIGVFTMTAALTLLTVVGFYSMHRSSDEALLGLPPSERAMLLERTLATLRTTCAYAGTGELVTFCREQAQFIAPFPECDLDCQALCRQFSPRPTK